MNNTTTPTPEYYGFLPNLLNNLGVNTIISGGISDDGKPTYICIKYKDNSNIVRIYADINYIGNEHTNYTID